MTGSRYPEAFEGDGYIEAEVRRLVGKWDVKTIVETGTHFGKTTRALADMGCEVVTIEIAPVGDPAWQVEMSGLRNVHQYSGDSAQFLGEVLPMMRRLGQPYLFYLDAHWGAHSPLLDELEAIGQAGLKPVIAIHDFFNPEHPEYGFDEWDIGAYRLELIAPLLEKIYGVGGWRHWYNGDAEGLKRGIIYVEAKA